MHRKNQRIERRIVEEGKPATVDLNGKFSFKIDAKGRMSLPSKFRRALPTEDLVVTQDLHGECLYVFTDDEFNNWVNRLFEDKFGGYHPADTKQAHVRTLLKGRASDVRIDSAGRIMLTAEQRQAAGIGKDVVIVGNTGYFEVWDAKRYEQLEREIDLDSLFA